MTAQDQTNSDNKLTSDVIRGVSRMLYHHDLMPMTEVSLSNGRRADIVALGRDGRITLVEVKTSLADLRSDLKWPEYLDYCDRFYWAVPSESLSKVLDEKAFLPERTGIIVADRYGGAIVREAVWVPLHAARRKSEQLRFARRAARRLLLGQDHELRLEKRIS